MNEDMLHSGKSDRAGIQVKICGLTRVDEAIACAELGAAAIGCVFFPPSPRFVTDLQAREICAALPKNAVPVGVFVDVDYDTVMRRVEVCGIRMAQLHGRESPELVGRLQQAGVEVIKSLFVNKAPGFELADQYPAKAFLAECAGGKLPGGNAMGWDWKIARNIGEDRLLVLAGGLNVETVAGAIAMARPDAVDLSSGVESEPGRKDASKVVQFMEAVSRCVPRNGVKPVFVAD
jgi:phosphoribosylanthranilate isomerase